MFSLNKDTGSVWDWIDDEKENHSVRLRLNCIFVISLHLQVQDLSK